jgi:hypothetical protein
MRFPVFSVLMAAALGLALSTAEIRPVSAESSELGRLARQIQSGELAAEYAQWRRYRGPRYSYRPYYARPYAGRYYRRHRDGTAAAVIGGLAAGAIIGGAIASQNAQAADNAAAYCAQRFRSYDPASGTYLGYGGLRHPCP